MRSLLPVLLLFGCPSAEPWTEPIDLVAADRWTWLEGDDDPFTDGRPDDLDCSQLAVRAEEGSIEVQTELCSWVTLSQPTLGPVFADDRLDLLFFHNALAAPLEEVDPAATIELWLAGEPLWQTVVRMPHAAELHRPELTPGRDLAPGAELLLHIHNHGQNSYRLTHLQRLPPQ